MMSPLVRKVALTAHVTTSVGWLGAVGTFLALAVTGVASGDGELVRGVYLAAEVTAWLVIVPLSVASLLSGLVQALGTPWGLVRHYWVLVKLALTVVATVLLLVHTRVVDQVAEAAAARALSGTDLAGMRTELVVDAALAVVVLVITAALSVLKPRGVTGYGRRPRPAPAS
ncbi:DUF2269 domain-containing protein [Amycolatopsis sp. NPDC051903]|uniref:DUF2269 domain-containing protein n=1 Tax=Amycolatopsis sp. NPDC051903 TaxID=3363936 RepID=UPI003789ED98